MSQDRVRVRARATGLVQGVFFRDSTRRTAEDLGVSGWVRNRADGSVELEAEGPETQVERLIEWCRRGPAGARVDHLEVEHLEPSGDSGPFAVRH